MAKIGIIDCGSVKTAFGFEHKEIMVFDRVLNKWDRHDLQTYLEKKWGVKGRRTKGVCKCRDHSKCKHRPDWRKKS